MSRWTPARSRTPLLLGLASLLLVAAGCSDGEIRSGGSGDGGGSGSGSDDGGLSESQALEYGVQFSLADPCANGRVDSLQTGQPVFFADSDGRRELSASGIDAGWESTGFCLATPEGGVPVVVFGAKSTFEDGPKTVVGFDPSGRERWRVDIDDGTFNDGVGGFALSPGDLSARYDNPKDGRVYSATTGKELARTVEAQDAQNFVVRDEQAYFGRVDGWQAAAGGPDLVVSTPQGQSPTTAEFAWAGETLVSLVDDTMTLLPPTGQPTVITVGVRLGSPDPRLFADKYAVMVSSRAEPVDASGSGATDEPSDDPTDSGPPEQPTEPGDIESYDPRTGELNWSSDDLDLELPDEAEGQDTGAGAVLISSVEGSLVLDGLTGEVVDVGSDLVVGLTDDGALVSTGLDEPLDFISTDDWK